MEVANRHSTIIMMKDFIQYLYEMNKISIINKIILIKHMFESCCKSVDIFCSSFDQTSLIEGITDVIVVKHKTGQYRSTKFFVCLGPYAIDAEHQQIKMYVNKKQIPQPEFKVDRYGYLDPHILTSEQLQKMGLKYGKNTVEYKLSQMELSAEIYLYAENDQLVVSDVDGTLTKNDIGGLYNNYKQQNFLHDGYKQLVEGVAENGYKIVWMTMRSLPMYSFSKKYISKHVSIEGPVLMEPEQFFHAMKKQIFKKAGNVKANIMKSIKEIFPENVNPFAGGLGNRQTDAVAYRFAGVTPENIYLIDTDSQVHKLNFKDTILTYSQLVKQINSHFPKFNSMKVGYF